MNRGLHRTGNRRPPAPPGIARAARADTRRFLQSRVCDTTRQRRGLTLLEVVLALAIFLAAVAALRQLTELGSRAAIQTDAQSAAVLRAETKLAELLAGVVPIAEGAGGRFADAPGWRWELLITPGPHASLRVLTLTVIRDQAGPQPPVRFSLTRWVNAEELKNDATDVGGLP